MESIANKVAIVGMGCTQFGELWDKDPFDLVVDATYLAFEDAGVGPKDIQAAWVGTQFSANSGLSIAMPLQLQYIPISRVENNCATGIDALRNAAFAVAAKAYDLVLVVGFEKYKDRGYAGTTVGGLPSDHYHPVQRYRPGGAGGPSGYALSATRYFAKYGLSPEQGKTVLAKISVKSHYNGSRNPRAHLRREITVEQALNAPMIAWPLGLFDCCGTSDGAAAAIICRPEDANSFRKDWVTFKGFGISVGAGQGDVTTEYDYTHWEETTRASQQAYQQAGITNPRKQLSLIECHDCFSIAELIAIESMAVSELGKGWQDVEAGTFTQEGEIPVNLSGGLKSFGHPVGASGCRETYEIYKQLQGKAELPSRQLENVDMGLVHNQGGGPGAFQCGVAILGRP